MINDHRIRLLNDFWSALPDFELKRLFIFDEGRFEGEIILKAAPKDDLHFLVRVPLSYPLSNDSISIRFHCLNANGYRHMNADNSICIVVPKDTNFAQRLQGEAALLCKWRDKFYISNEEDDRYEYPIISFASNNSFLFTDSVNEFKVGHHGHFFAVKYADNGNENFESRNYIIQKFDNNLCEFSGAIVDQPPTIKGFYYFVKQEPVINGRLIIENWSDLNTLISQRFKQELYELSSSTKMPNEVFLMLGYYIPGTTEVHWTGIILDRRKLPVSSHRVSPGNYEYRFKFEAIRYCKTFNCSYDRFFGRGALSSEFNHKKILIIGAGAVGSSLAKVLVRSGVKNLNVSDFDRVEPGNICRSEYNLKNISELKWLALLKDLVVISPFVSVGQEEIISKIMDEPYKTADKERLSKYDVIFDCSSDMEATYFLDQLKLDSTIINISLSNEAKELVCVMGCKNIAIEKNLLFERLNAKDSLLVYEGTGCWSPTFKASYLDINALLNLAVKKLDYLIKSGKSANTFITRYQTEEGAFNISTIDY